MGSGSRPGYIEGMLDADARAVRSLMGMLLSLHLTALGLEMARSWNPAAGSGPTAAAWGTITEDAR